MESPYGSAQPMAPVNFGRAEVRPPDVGFGPRVQAALRGRSANEQRQILEELRKPKTGEELHALIQVDPTFRFNPDKPEEFLAYKAYKRERHTSMADDMAAAVDYAWGLTKSGVAGLVTDEEGDATYKGVLKFLPSLIESTAQGTRDMVGMVAQSDDPNSFVFNVSKALWGDGNDVASEIGHLNKALDFNEQTRRYQSGQDTMTLPAWMMDNRQVQALALFMDLPTAVGFVTPPGMAAKVAKVVGLERAAKAMRGLRVADYTLRTKVALEKLGNATIDLGLRGSSAAVKTVADVITNTVDAGVNVGGKVIEFGTGLKADEIVSVARKIGSVSPLAMPLGYSIPFVSTTATTYMAASAAKGMAEALDEIRKVMKRQAGQRTLVSFAQEAIEDAAVSGVKLSPTTMRTLQFLNAVDPFLTGSWTLAKATTKGAVVGGVLGFLNGGVQAIGFGAGTGGYLGFGGGTIGLGVSEVLGASTRLRLENQAAVVIQGLKKTNPKLARELEIALGMPTAGLPPGLINSNAHREALLRFAILQKNLDPANKVELEIVYGMKEDKATGEVDALDKIVERMEAEGYAPADIGQYRALRNGGGLAFRSKTDNKIRILLDANHFYKPGGELLLHEFTHGLGLNSRTKSWIGAAVLGVTYGTFRKETMEGGGAGYRLIGRGMVSYADMRNHAKSWVEASLRDKAIGPEYAKVIEQALEKTDVVGNESKLLTQEEFDALAKLADEFYTEYGGRRLLSDDPVFLRNGGRRTGLDAVSNMLKERLRRTLAREINHSEPDMFFNRVMIGSDGKEYTDVNSGYVDNNGNLVRNAALDAVYESTLRAASISHERGVYDLSELHPAIRDTVLFNLGLDSLMERDQVGRVNRRRKGGKLPVDDKMALGPEAVKFIRSLPAGDRTSVDTIDGGTVGPFSDKELGALVLRGYLSEAFADKIRLLQRMVNDPSSTKVIAFDYHGASMQRYVDSDNARLFGDDVPMTSREVMVVDFDVEFDAKGNFVARIKALDLVVIDQRIKSIWSKPEVKSLWNNNYEEFHRDFFQKYLGNASRPKGDPERVESSQLWVENGEAKRNVMHQVAGFAKADDLTWLNVPIAQIPRGTMMSMTDFTVGRMSLIQEQSQREPIHYDNKNAFHDISRNFRPKNWTEQQTPVGSMWTNPLGYRILKMENEFRVIHPDGTFVGKAGSGEDAASIANDDFDNRANTMQQRINAEVEKVHDSLQGRTLQTVVPESNHVPFTQLTLQTVAARMAANGATVYDIVEALAANGLPIQKRANGSYQIGPIVFKPSKKTINSPVAKSPFEASKPFDPAFIAADAVLTQLTEQGERPYRFSQFLSDCYYYNILRHVESGRGFVADGFHATFESPLYRENVPFDGGIAAKKDNINGVVQVPGHVYIASHPIGAGMAVKDLSKDRLAELRSGEFEKINLESHTDYSGVTSRPMVLTRHAFEKPFVLEMTPQREAVLFAEALKDGKLRALMQGEFANRPFQKVKNLMLPPLNRETMKNEEGVDIVDAEGNKVRAPGARNHDILTRYVYGKIMSQAVDAGHDGLVVRNSGKSSNIPYRSVDFIKLYPGDNAYSSEPGVLVDNKIQIVARTASVETTTGRLVLNDEVSRLVDSNPGVIGELVGISADELRSNPDLYRETMTEDGLQRRSIVSEKAGKLQFLHRPKSVTALRVNKFTKDPSIYRDWFRRLNALVYSTDRDERPFPSVGVRDANDLRYIEDRFSDVFRHAAEQFDRGTMTKEEFDSTLGEVRRQYFAMHRVLAEENVIAGDVFRISSSLDDDFNLLKNDGSSLIGGMYQGYNGLLEIGPYHANDMLDARVRSYTRREGMTFSDEDVFSNPDNARGGNQEKFLEAVREMASHFNSTAGGLVRLELVNRTRFAEGPETGDEIPRWTFVWTEKAIEIRDAYRAVIPQEIWRSPRFDFAQEMRTNRDLLNSLKSNAEFMARQVDFKNILDKAFSAGNMLYRTVFGQRHDATHRAREEHISSNPEDYESYKERRGQEREKLAEKTLNEVFQNAKDTLEDGANRFPGPVGLDLLEVHREHIDRVEEINALVREAEMLDAQQGGDKNIKALMAGYLNRASQHYMSRHDVEPDALGNGESVTSNHFYVQMMSMKGIDPMLEIMKPLGIIDFLQKTQGEFDNIAYTGAFKSGLNTAVEAIISSAPAGMTAKNFRKELEKVNSSGIPAMEEARITGFLDYLSEKEKLPNLPNGKSPKLDYAELRKFLESTRIEVEMDPKARLNTSGNGSAYTMSPTWYTKSYDIHVARVAPERYYTSRYNGSQHVRKKGQDSNGERAHDTILHQRFTLREFPQPDGSVKNALFLEESQANNDKRYQDNAFVRLNYESAVYSAIDRSMETLNSLFGVDKTDKPAEALTYDPNDADSIAMYFNKIAPTFLSEGTGVRELLMNPAIVFGSVARTVVDGSVSAFNDDGNPRFYPDTELRQKMNLPALTPQELAFERQAFRLVADLSTPIAKDWADVAGMQIKNYGEHMRKFVEAMSAQAVHMGTSQTTAEGMNALKNRVRNLIRVSRNIRPGHALAPADMKKILTDILPRLDASADAFTHYSRSHAVMTGFAIALAKLMPKEGYDAMRNIALRFHETKNNKDHISRGFTEGSIDRKENFEAIATWKEEKIDGMNYAEHIEKIYEKYVTEPALVDGPMGPFGERTKVYEIPLQAGPYSREYGVSMMASGEKVIRLPYIDRPTLAKLVMSAMDGIHRLPNTQPDHIRDVYSERGFAAARSLHDAIYDRKQALVYTELTELVTQYLNAGYLEFAMGLRVDDLIDHAKSAGFKVGRNLASFKSTTALQHRTGMLLKSMFEQNKSGHVPIASSGGNKASLRSSALAFGSNMRADSTLAHSKGKKYGDDMATTKHTHILGEEQHSMQAFMLKINPGLLPSGVPERFLTNISDSYEALITNYVTGVFARADVLHARGIRDPKDASKAFTRTYLDSYNVYRKYGWAKYQAVFDSLVMHEQGTSAGAHSVVQASGLANSPLGAFFVTDKDATTNPADLAARNSEDRNNKMYLFNQSAHNQIIPGFAETVKQLRAGAMTADVAANRLKQVLGGLYTKEQRDSDKTFSKIPFLQSEEYFAIGFKMALREAFVRGVDQIVLIPALEGGSRSGLPNSKAHPIYTTLYPARAKKIMKGYKAEDAVKMPDMARAPTVHPTKTEEQLYKDATQASANLNAAKKNLLELVKDENGQGEVVMKPDAMIGNFIIRNVVNVNDMLIGGQSRMRLPDLRLGTPGGAGETMTVVRGNNLLKRLNTALDDDITIAGSGWRALMDRNNASAETGMEAPDHRYGTHIPADLPHMMREIFAANMYKATMDIGTSKRRTPQAAADLAAQYCLKAYHGVINQMTRLGTMSPDSAANGLYAAQRDGIRHFLEKIKELEHGVRSGDPDFTKPIEKHLENYRQRVPEDMGRAGHRAYQAFIKANPEFNNVALADGIKKNIDAMEAVLGEIDALYEYYSSVDANTLRGTAMMTRGLVIDMKKAAPIRDKVMDGQFFYRTKGVKGGFKVGDRAWKTGFLSEVSQAMPNLLRNIRMFYSTNPNENTMQNHHEVVIYPRGADNLAGDRREVRVVAMADPKASVATTHVVSSDVGGKLALLAMNELERRLNILGVRHVIGDNENAVAFGRVDTHRLPMHRPTSFKSALADTANGRELTERLNTMGYRLMWGAPNPNQLDEFIMTDPTESTRFALQKPVRMMLALTKNEADPQSTFRRIDARHSYFQFEINPDGTAEVLPDYGGDSGGYLGMPKGWASGIFDDPKAAESCFRMLMLAESMARLKEHGVHEVKGFERFVLPDEDSLWDNFEGTAFVPRSYEPKVEKTDDIPVNRHDDQHPAVGDYLAWENSKRNRIKYEEFRNVVRDRNVDIRNDYGDPAANYTPNGYFHNYGGFFLNPPLAAKIPDDISYRPKRVWDMGKTGNYTTISSSDGYFLMLSQKGWKLFSPQRTMLGIYEEREEAFKRAEKHAQKGK